MTTEHVSVPRELDNLTDQDLAEFVAIGLRHAEVKNFRLDDLRPAFKKLKAILSNTTSAQCDKCGQSDNGQTGEYPCSKCGLPILHDAILSRATPSDDSGEYWEVRFICCGRDDGNTIVNSYTEADAIRESYTSGVGVNPHGYSEAHKHDGGHQRVAVVSRFSTSPKERCAPCVVTDADVERACSAYYGRGIYAKWENFDEFAKASQREYMRAALESFVNGGSNE